MFVTSDICTCDLSATNMYMILIIMILYNKRRVATAYPAVPELMRVDIAVVDVVVPLDAVQ